MGKIRVGVSGWSYDEWQDVFYPEDVPKDDRLAYATRVFDSIEINGTFYTLTSPDTCRAWKEAAPRGFRYSLKGSRYITHVRRLKEPHRPLANFFASGILELGEMMGPIVWQLPANYRFDREVVDRFLDALPHDTESASDLARDHDDRVEKASYGDGENHRLRHAFEFRHSSFETEELVRIVRRHGVAICSSHSSEWPYVEEITAGFVYLRLHGPKKLYASPYPEKDLDRWCERILDWRSGGQPDDARRITDLDPPDRLERDVYVYFDNTADGYAPADARYLMEQIEAR